MIAGRLSRGGAETRREKGTFSASPRLRVKSSLGTSANSRAALSHSIFRSTSSPRPSARKSSTFLRGETTPGDGQSVPHSTLSAMRRRCAGRSAAAPSAGCRRCRGARSRWRRARKNAVSPYSGRPACARMIVQPREVDGHVVDRHRIGEDVARAREDRRPGVEHHRHAALLALAIDLRELPQLAAIGVRREELVRRMDLDHADAEVEHAADLVAHVDLVQRIHRADRQQPVAMIAREVRDPVVDLAREAHHVRRHVVDAAGPLDRPRRRESAARSPATPARPSRSRATGRRSSPALRALTICHGWMWTWTSKTRMAALYGAPAPRRRRRYVITTSRGTSRSDRRSCRSRFRAAIRARTAIAGRRRSRTG